MSVKRVPGKGAEMLKKAVKNVKPASGGVGWFPSARYEKTKENPQGLPVATVAAINEHGSHARPFFRPTVSEKQSEWKALSESGAKAILSGNADSETVLEGLLVKAEGDVRKKITEIDSPPLAPATIAARLRKRADGKTVGNLTKPLVDTRYMLNTLTHALDK